MCSAAACLPVFVNESVDVVKIFRVTCYRMLAWPCAVSGLLLLGWEPEEHLGDRAGSVFLLPFPVVTP